MFIIIETKQGTSYQLECPIDLDADDIADVFVVTKTWRTT